MSTTPRFCIHCGTPVSAGARFCGQCGQAVQPLPAAPAPTSQATAPAPPQPAAPAAPAEPIYGIIPGLRRGKGFLGMGSETFNLILTPGRMVFASFTQQMMKEAVVAARQEAKSQGKGFLGQWGAQMGWLEQICRPYHSMPVDAIIASNPGSFFIPYGTVKRVRVNQTGDDDEPSRTELMVEAAGGKHRFDLTGMSAHEARKLLRQILPQQVI